ncbi:MAG: hypothetical protein IPP57_23280 [Candidatus Obscuribacter sp.]|nr:hypothetical protein [Candidatus Obscuribacter sp.]
MLNKASVVMICAAWEAFCEDLITEAVGLLTTHCVDYNHLPLLLKKSVARAVKEDKHDLSPWDLAGIGWTRKVKALATAAIEAKTGNFKHHRGAS